MDGIYKPFGPKVNVIRSDSTESSMKVENFLAKTGGSKFKNGRPELLTRLSVYFDSQPAELYSKKNIPGDQTAADSIQAVTIDTCV